MALELNELMHKVVDGVSWSSGDNADEAHKAVDEHFAPKAPAKPIPAVESPAKTGSAVESSAKPSPAVKEGNE